MKIERAMFRSLVARRITLLFGLCAIIPILALGLLSYLHVNNQVLDQSHQRLLQNAKSFGMTVYERLTSLQAEMEMITSVWRAQSDAVSWEKLPNEHLSLLDQHCYGLKVLYSAGKPIHVFGRDFYMPELKFAEKQKGFSGEVLVLTRISGSQEPRVFMAVPFSAENGETALLLTEVRGLYLWYGGTNDTLPGQTELHVLDLDKNIVFSSIEGAQRFPDHTINQMQPESSGWFSWSLGEVEYLAGFRDLFMESRFYASKWTFVVSEAKSYAIAPAAYFKRIYPPVLIFTILAVIFLSLTQIHKNLGPLEKLKAGAEEMAQKNFGTRVDVSSKDEFGEVARSFNEMAIELGRQFKSLSVRAEIDRAVLATMESSEIARTLLRDVRYIHPCQGICVTFLQEYGSGTVISYYSLDADQSGMGEESSVLGSAELEQLRTAPDSLTLTSPESAPRFLKPLLRRGMTAFHIFPIFLNNKLAGVISLGYEGGSSGFKHIERVQVRQLVDQVGVALSNARLVKELRLFHWGTLTALARAIDAKSHWTAGHSENVTRIALKIGKVLKLNPEELDLLRRGGLLHDIGKLGIPNVILDAKRKLSRKEFETIQTHPYLGAQILEPISSFADVVDIVIQHHENFDGSGYPNRISHEDISLYSRIVALADRYDAMTADRPYRRAYRKGEAVKLIIEKSGRWFDPKVVDAFMLVINQEDSVRESGETGSSFFINRSLSSKNPQKEVTP